MFKNQDVFMDLYDKNKYAQVGELVIMPDDSVSPEMIILANDFNSTITYLTSTLGYHTLTIVKSNGDHASTLLTIEAINILKATF